MRLALVTGAYPDIHDGIGDYTGRLAQALAQQDHVTAVVTSCDPQVRTDLDLGVEVHPIVRQWNARGVCQLLSFCRRWRPDVVDLQFPSSRFVRTVALSFTPLFARLRRLVPCFTTTLHEFGVYGIKNRIRQLVYAMFSHRVVVTNRADLELIGRMLPPCRHKLRLIHIGSNIPRRELSSEAREQRRRQLGLEVDDPLLVHFGFIHENKGVDLLIDALAMLRSTWPNLRLLIVGEFNPQSSPFHSMLERKVHELNLRSIVASTGYCSPAEVSYHLQAADLVAMPFRDGVSYRRGTFLAALDHGLPVVTTQPKGPMPDGLTVGDGLVLVEAGSSRSLAEGVDRWLRLRDRRSTAAYPPPSRLPAKFRWDTIAQQIVSVAGKKSQARGSRAEAGESSWA